jgi:hypothetical protein
LHGIIVAFIADFNGFKRHLDDHRRIRAMRSLKNRGACSVLLRLKARHSRPPPRDRTIATTQYAHDLLRGNTCKWQPSRADKSFRWGKPLSASSSPRFMLP